MEITKESKPIILKLAISKQTLKAMQVSGREISHTRWRIQQPGLQLFNLNDERKEKYKAVIFTFTVEQKVIPVVTEGASDVSTAVSEITGQTAAVEGADRVCAETTTDTSTLSARQQL